MIDERDPGWPGGRRISDRRVARDRGGAYGLAAAKALPDAVQVADRCELMENASLAFLNSIRKSMRQIRKIICATRINPKVLVPTERPQHQGCLRREQTNAVIMAIAKGGARIKKIVRRAGHRGLVRQPSGHNATTADCEKCVCSRTDRPVYLVA